MQVNCLDFSMAIVYIVFTLALGVWAIMLIQRRQIFSVFSARTKPLLTETSPNEAHSAEDHDFLSAPEQV